ncbi:MAG TPA: hypothetical protein P5110_06055, partial [Candidatus Omnitrophota bacterium]|nr:hypothetical protein [Candidatus Omnitrophota bacterium]
MKKLSMHILTCVSISLFLSAGPVFAQSAPTPQEQEDQKEMGVYSPELEAANQNAVDTKNQELAAAAAADAAIPAVSAPDTTTTNGTIVLTFQGTLLPADLSQLWARVTYNGKTEYWKLDPAMIAADGKSFSMQFNPSFNGTTFQMALYGFSAGTNEQTNFSNNVTFKINVPSTVTMPASTAPAQTNEAGRITVTFSQTILPEQLNALWAKISYDGKTEYWKLAPGMIAPDGKTFSMKFDPKFNGKQVTMELYGYAAGDGAQTNYSNPVTFTVSSSGSLTMPSATVPAETDLNGKITATFSSPMLPSQLSDLWAIVSYDGKTEYWDLDASMISSDGRTFSMVFDSAFNNKQITMQLYGYSASTGAQTTVGNQLTFKVTPSTSIVTMPTVQATGNTDPTGKIVVSFTSGTLLASQINDLWAQVTYDGKTYYWDLDPAMLAADGKSLTMEFGSEFDGKTVSMEFYAFDKSNVQTGFSNPIAITVHSSSTGLTMPVIPATGTTDTQGTIVIPFNEGTLLASQINDLWAEVTYDGEPHYWDLNPEMLAADGKSVTVAFGSEFDGKTVSMKFYAFDTNNVQTGFSNAITITVHSNPQNISMPVIPSTGTTDNQGKIVIPFSNGTLLASQISDLWAQVTY